MADPRLVLKIDTAEAEKQIRDLAKRAEAIMESKTKPGIKTTEFWFILAVEIFGAVLASGLLIEGSLAATIVGGAMMVLGGLGYSRDRAKVKAEDSRQASRASHAVAGE